MRSEAWCAQRVRWIGIVDVGLYLGSGESTYAECCGGVQALLACLSLLCLMLNSEALFALEVKWNGA